MGFKDNFKQAAKELTEPRRSSDFTQPTAPQGVSTKAEAVTVPVKTETEPPRAVVGTEVHESKQVGTLRSDSEKNQNLEREKKYETTVIAAGTVIRGSIAAKGNLEICGVMTGDIVSGGTFILSGKQEGNVASRNAEFYGGYMKGDLTSTGLVSIDEGTVIIGNIQAEKLRNSGKIKGNPRVRDSLNMGNHSVIIGSVTAGSVTMDEGAIFQGNLNISDKETDGMFKEPDKSGM